MPLLLHCSFHPKQPSPLISFIWALVHHIYPVNTIPVVSVSQTPPPPQHLYNNCIRNIVAGSHLHYIYPRKTVLLVSCFTAPPITPPPSTSNTTVSVPRWQAPHYWCPGRTAPPVRGGMCWASRCTRPLRFCPAGAHSNHSWIMKNFIIIIWHHYKYIIIINNCSWIIENLYVERGY